MDITSYINTGKLFKCVELPWLIQFFLMFHNDKPVDWLLDHLISTKVCSLDKDSVSIDNKKRKPFNKLINQNGFFLTETLQNG